MHPISDPSGDASTQVHLVSIVGARVVGCGDHDPGVGMKRADGEGGDGRRQAGREEERSAASCGNDLGGGGIEVAGAVAGVATDDHTGPFHLPPQPVHEPVGGTRNDGPVHSAFPSPHLAAQSSGAEGEWPGKTALQFGCVHRVLKEVQHIGCGLRVGVMGGPVTCHIGDAHDLQLIDAPSILGPT